MNKSIMRIGVLVLFLCLTLSASAQQYSYDYESMSMDEYRAELAKWQQRLTDAEAALAEEDTRITQLNDEIAKLEEQIASTYQEMYALMDTDEAGYKEFLSEAKTLDSDVNGYLALSPQDMYTRKNELDGYKDRAADLSKDKRSLGIETFEIMSQVEGMIKQAEEKMRSAVIMYEVVRGDYLWKIARKPDIYGDPYAWIRIYTANRDQIKNPDLIYPRQVFRVPKLPAPNEHWVERGEHLSKIAGYAQVYGNPFQWQKIYEANKEVISDPNLIYPHMILVIPRD